MPAKKKPIKRKRAKAPSKPSTKRKKVSRTSAAEEQLKIALEAASMGIWEWNIIKDTVLWSPGAYQIFKIRKSQTLSFTTYQKLIHPDDLEYVLQNIKNTITLGAQYFIQHRIIRDDGAIRWIEAVGKVFKDAKRNPIKMLGTVCDITDRKTIALEKEDWKTRYELIVGSSGQLIYDYDIDTGAILWAGDTKGVLGFTREEMGDIDHWVKMIHPKDRKRALDELEKAQSELRNYEVHYRFKTKKRNYREIYDRGMFLSKNNKAYRMLGVMVDITREVTTQNILEEKSLFIESITHAMPDIINVLDIKTLGIVFSNRDFLSEIGYTYDELDNVRKNIHKILSPESLNNYLTFKDKFDNIENNELVQSEFSIKGKDGNWVWFSGQYTVFKKDKNGNPIQVIGTLRDISDQKRASQELIESEERFKTLQQASYGGLALHDLGIIIDCNQGLSDITQYPYEELIGMNGLLLIVPEHRPLALKNIQANYELPYDVDGLRKDGSRISMEVRGKDVPYKGKMIRVTEFRDITERKRSAEKIIEQNQKLIAITEDLKRKNDQLEEFTQIVSHNLRSPVGNILSLLTYYEETTKLSEKEEYFSLLKESANNTLLTLNELNDVLKVKQNKNIEKQEITFEKVLQYVRSMISVDITESGAIIDYDFSQAPTLHYPNIYLESILLNLMSNSLKYKHPSRSPHIQIRSYLDNGSTLLTVTDNGLGIDMEKYGHQLFRMRKTFHRHPESRGVGLFLIKSQINAMGGEISAESKINEGITFTIKF